MDDLVKALIEKNDKLDERLDSIDKTLIVMGEDLKYHIRRTDLLEDHVSGFQNEVKADLKPLNEHLVFLKKLGQSIRWLGITCGAILALGGTTKLLISFLQ